MNNNSTHKTFTQRLRRFFGSADTMAAIFPWLMIVPNVLLDITESMSIGGKIANILVPLSVYYLLMSAWRKAGRTILLTFIFIVMNGFQITVLHLFGESIIAVDMLINCVTTDTGEAAELLGNLALPMALSAVLYLPMLFWGAWTLWRHVVTTERFRRFTRRWSLVGLACGVVVTAATILLCKPYSPLRDLYPINVCSNIVTALHRISDSASYHRTSADFTYDAVDLRAEDDSTRRVVVLMIGETSRSLNWELFGYDRNTNPRLAEMKDSLIIYPRAVTQSNTTHKCVPLMLTHTSPADFDSIMYRKSVITAFREAGFSTAFFSNQPKNHSYTQFFGEEADTTVYLGTSNRYDHLLGEMLVKHVNENPSKRQFIILHAYGSHFSYRDRYPSEFAYFTPDNSSGANILNRKQLLNAYDNSIRYTDGIVADIIDFLSSTGAEATFIFVSDHGEDIFDDYRERILHASPVPTYYQLRVPLLFWTSDGYASTHSGVIEALKANAGRYVAPSQSIFHTLLQMADIDTPYLDLSQSIASDDYSEPRPVFLNDYNEGAPLEECGIKEIDIELFQSIGLLNNIEN